MRTSSGDNNASLSDAALLRAILDAANYAIVATDAHGTVTLFNRSAEAMLLYTEQEIVGQQTPALWHDQSEVERHAATISKELGTVIPPNFEAFVAKAKRGQPDENRWTLIRKDGNRLTVHLSVTALPATAENGTRFLGVIRDLTNEIKAEEALRQSEMRYGTLVENIKDYAIFQLDTQGHVRSWSTGAEHIYGYTAEEILGKHFSIFYSVQDNQAGHPEDELRTALNTGRAEGEGRRLKKSGTHCWVSVVVTPIRDHAGKHTGFAKITRDITQQHQALERLRISEQRFRDAVEYSAIGIATVGLDGRWISVNTALCKLLGHGRDTLMGLTFQDITHPDDLNADLENVRNLIAGRSTHYHMQKRYFHRQGHIVWAMLSVSLVRDSVGEPLYFVSQIQDITAQKTASDELAASAALLAQFIKHTPAAIAMLDRNMCYLHTSDRWLIDYHLKGRDVIGRSHYEIFPDIPDRWKQIHARVLQGEVERCDEDPFPRADGSTEWLQWEARPWHNSSGEIGGLVFYTQVITRQKESQQELVRLVRELERSNAELEQFAYVASHDLQEPLRAVAGCAEILAQRYQGKLDASADELIRHVVEGAQRMQSLIHDLLQLSRVSSRGGHFESVDLNETCQHAMLNLSESITRTEATVTFDLLPVVRADPTQMLQLVQNLVGNALKYRRNVPPCIKITAQQKPDGTTVCVEDNGIGIEPRYFDRIFKVFQRLHTRNEYPGTGIGLAICQKIVQRHGGRIWVESTLGVGSKFYFSIPPSSSPATP